MRWARVAAVLVASVGAASCSAADVTEDAKGTTELAQPSPERSTAEVRSGRVHVELVPGSDGVKVPQVLDLEIDLAIADGGDLVSLDAEVDDRPDSNPRGPEMEIVLEEQSQVYLRMASGPKRMLGKWMVMSFHEFGGQLPNFEGLLEFADASDLLNAGAWLSDEKVAGHATLRGVETTMYESRAAVEEIEGAIWLPDGLVEAMGAETEGEVRFTAWIDDEGLVRRVVFPIKGSLLSPRLGDAEVLYRLDVSDHGEDIKVALPAEADTVRL